MRSRQISVFMALGLLLGAALGQVAHSSFPADAAAVAEAAALLPTLFLRMIKMIIAPLVLTTLVVGIAKMGDLQTIGRVGGKALAWFILASLLSLGLGLILVNLFEPGKALQLKLPTDAAPTGITAGGLTLQAFVAHLVPTSIADAMARNEILQIVVFALFFGSAAAALGERGKPLIDLFDAVAHIMLRITTTVMLFAPFAVFGAVASVIAKEGLGIIATYGIFIGEFYLGLLLLWLILIALGAVFIGGRVFRLLRHMREPILLAFATASSESAYPKTLEQLERFGCSNKVASFLLPLGYSFNLDGSMMYCTFALLFVAQAYGIEFSLANQILMLLILLVTSKGIAGVPRASLVVVAAALPQFNIPEAGLLLLLGVDHFLDMGRTATNVVGNSVATAVIAKWEGELRS